MNTKSFNKIIIALAIAFTVAVPLCSNAQGIPVGDSTTEASTVNTTVQSTLTQVDDFFGHLKTFGLDGLAYGLAQLASQKLVSSVLNAVNGGASASKPPNYISNYASYFASLGGKTTTNYYNSLQYSTNPFAKGIANGIINNQSGFARSGLNAFNLNTILSNGSSWQSASTNLTAAGIQGWDFYSALSYPQNTPAGSNLLAQQQLSQNVAGANSTAQIQLTSSGYKPQTAAGTGQGIFASVGSKVGVNTNSLISASQNQVTQNQMAAAAATEHGGSGEITYADGSYVLDGVYYNSTSDPIGTVSSDGNIYDNNGTLMGSSQGGADGLPNGITDYNDTENGGASIGNPTDASNQDASTGLPTQTAAPISDVPGSGLQLQTLPTDASTSTTDSGSSSVLGGSNWSVDNSNVPQAPGADNTTVDPNQGEALQEDYSGVDDVGANVTTPSATTSANVNAATQETQKRYQNANQFFELVAATLTQMVTGLINKGISSLTSDAGQSSPYKYGSPVASTNSSNWLAGPQTIIDFRNDLDIANQDTALDVQYDENTLNLLKAPVTGTVLNSAQIAANDPVSDGTPDVLQRLEQCIPGPDTGWAVRLQDYANENLQSTDQRGEADTSGNGANNARAYTTLEQQVNLAIAEEDEMVENPFLNIPGASAMSTIASSFYASAQQFQGLFSTLITERQISSQLETLVAQVKAFIPSLVLFDDQWQKMNQAQQNALYAQLSPQIVIDSVAGDFSSNYTTTDANGNAVLTPLAANTVANPNAANQDEESRVLDEEWQVWETDTTHITETERQTLYAQFAAIENSVTDPGTLQSDKNTMNSVAQQNTDIADAYHDCELIRNATQNYKQYTTQADWDAFKNTLYSNAIKADFLPNTSIIAVANGTSGIDFSKYGDITLPLDKTRGDLPTGDFTSLSGTIVPRILSSFTYTQASGSNPSTTVANIPLSLVHNQHSNDPTLTPYVTWVDAGGYDNSNYGNINQLQVQPDVPLTIDTTRLMTYGQHSNDNEIGTPDVIGTLFKEDADGTLFCRLSAYDAIYWNGTGLAGGPITCSASSVGSYSERDESSNNPWYSVNRAEIYYNLSSPVGTGTQ